MGSFLRNIKHYMKMALEGGPSKGGMPDNNLSDFRNILVYPYPSSCVKEKPRPLISDDRLWQRHEEIRFVHCGIGFLIPQKIKPRGLPLKVGVND